MGDGLQWSLCIDDHIDPWSMDLLALISVVSVSLSSNPVEYSVLKDPVPFQEEMRAMKVGPKCRVFLDEKKNQIIKLFCRSEGFYSSPNVDLMNKAGIQATITNLTENGEYFCLKYPFYPGDHCPKNMKQFRGIILMLDKIHEAGYVHCDIRIQNLIFSDNEMDSYLIDYDLAGKHQQHRYPAGYYYHESERHVEAKSCLHVDKRHDRQI